MDWTGRAVVAALLPEHPSRLVDTLENVQALHRVTTESSILWKTVCWLLPGLDFIPNKFDRQGVARMRPFSFPNVIDARLINAAAELVDPGSCGFSAVKVSPSKLAVAADPKEGHRFLNFGSEGQSNRAGHHSRGIALEPSLSQRRLFRARRLTL